ncbi:NAD(P)-binding protein, partial [Lichtheimia hyalospora FSU 10163]
MAQTAAKKLLVVGGTGFLGQSICKHATRQGWETISLSRHGVPETFRQGARPAWAEKVEWASGDSLDPSSYTGLLENVTDIVHTVGIISEVDYKSLANAKNLCEAASGASRVVGEMIGMRDRGNPLHAQHPAPTFERMNRDTAVALAQEAAKISTMDAFVYISASDIFPLVDPRYISSKRQAEKYLFSRPEFRTIALRPGFMYSQDRPVAMPVAAAIQLANMATSFVAKEVNSLPFGSSLTTPPLHIDTVAKAVIASINAPKLKGIFDVQGIQRLSHA